MQLVSVYDAFAPVYSDWIDITRTARWPGPSGKG
jgi:hypothetical protein